MPFSFMRTHTTTTTTTTNSSTKAISITRHLVKKQGQMKLTISIRPLVVHHDNECLKSTINSNDINTSVFVGVTLATTTSPSELHL